MKNLYKFFVVLFLLILLLQTGYSQYPTYTLTAKNFRTNCYNNQLEWDIYLKHTNPPVFFEYWGGRYNFNFDPVISNGGNLTFQITGTDLPVGMRPRNPIVGNFSGVTVLSLAFNSIPIEYGYFMTNNGGLNDSNGTLIVRVRLTTTTHFSFENNINFLQWRNSPLNPYTQIYASLDIITDITTPATHFIDINPLSIPHEILHLYPLDGTSDVYIPITFRWTRYNCNISNNKYKFELAYDSSFQHKVLTDSNVIDTFKTVNYISPGSVYYWRISGFDYDSNKFSIPSRATYFTTPGRIRLWIGFVLEGYYNNFINRLNKNITGSVYLREASPPYNIMDSAQFIIDSASIYMITNQLFLSVWDGNYYIVIKTINGLETWSKSGGVYFGSNNNHSYYFSDSINHAYGNNLKLKGTKYCIFSGDVNQDGVIDLSDLEIINEDTYHYSSGLILTSDLDGDNLTDLSDYSICDNNAFNNISVIRP